MISGPRFRTTMWLSPAVGLPISALGLTAQVPFLPQPRPLVPTTMPRSDAEGFAFKQGANIFSPLDLVKLARPGSGVANPAGDLLIVPVSKYSVDDKKYVYYAFRDRRGALTRS